ncbi:DUF5074 domain-containing protein [Chitinophaga rhizophila]|uniref:DUF5074 domain-containing protein n=1 Tax=Chitinophaga rhizophila TaxID=2866212 RepID=A0ABS7GGL0_9BACT|nr:DUF5074 domain-containing protein [Chitinophaga rhizophila]MBW8686824.1 DUF5074 domain-containing protein [Chitinophaga rhizophila]
MYKNLRTWLFGGLLLAAASCKNDDDIVIPSPQATAGKTTDSLYIGDSTLLHPAVNVKSDVTYKWTVNNTPSGTDSVFSFKPVASGDFEIVFEASNTMGKSTVTYKIHVWRKYENGFFIISEGNYGVKSGDVNFYDYGKDTVYEYAYAAENPGKEMGPLTSTMEFGAIHNGKLYVVGKFGGPLVVADAVTLKETGRIADLPANDGRAFVGINETTGLLSSAAGVYPVNLTTLTLGEAVSGINGEVTDMIKSGNYIFVMSAKEGIIALNAADYSVARKLGTAVAGFVESKDGSLWAASATQLKKINPATLEVDSITTGFPVYYNEYTYYNSSITASTSENAIYVISGANQVYKYVPGNAASLTSPFITLPAGQYFYGKGIAYDKARNYLVLNSNTNMYGADINNQLYIHNATTGEQLHATSYRGYFFPGMPVFQP